MSDQAEVCRSEQNKHTSPFDPKYMLNSSPDRTEHSGYLPRFVYYIIIEKERCLCVKYDHDMKIYEVIWN